MSHIASNPERHIGRSVDNGHCVRLTQVASGIGHTSTWRRGRKVLGSTEPIPHGTIIATFDENGRYANRTDGSSHAAIYTGHRPDSILVIDQWQGHPTATRVIRAKGSGPAVNDAHAFHIVETDA
jgi:hypothetical protein